MRFQCGENRFRTCDLEVREPVRRASGDRHLAPDNVYWRLSSRPPGGRLGGGREPSGALRHSLLVEPRRISAAGHAGVEVNLRKARRNIVSDHLFGANQGLRRRKMLPRIGSEVIAPQHDRLRVVSDLTRDRFNKAGEIGGRHASIAALLVDLIAGCLDDHGPIVGAGQRGFDDQGVRGADRDDADGPILSPSARQLGERQPAHVTVRPASQASRSEKLATPSMGPR